VAAIVAMARALELEPVAEGVETEPQAEQLAAVGCALMQGYLFDRPLPPDRFVESARRNRSPVGRCLSGSRSR
ncbi:MAG: EAL domain-containing protein, partial [Acidimicrobiia bacterium]